MNEQREPSTSERPMRTLLVVVIGVALGQLVALQPRWLGTRTPWLVMLGVYLGLAAWALVDLHKSGLLGERFRLRPGDTSVGILLGLGLAAAGVVGQRMLIAPDSAGERWLIEVYLAAGDFQTDGLSILLLFVLAVCEETVWRGMVQDRLARWKERSAPALTALGYAAACVPSVFLLSADGRGNPLLLLAALGSGLVWSYARRVVPRLLPLIVAHLVFTYFSAAPLPRWL
jgi:membrane protease YdiL (CAAX protease family)